MYLHIPVHVSSCACTILRLCLCPFVLFIHLHLYKFFSLYTHLTFANMYVFAAILSASIDLCLRLFISLSICVFLCVCLSVCLSLSLLLSRHSPVTNITDSLFSDVRLPVALSATLPLLISAAALDIRFGFSVSSSRLSIMEACYFSSSLVSFQGPPSPSLPPSPDSNLFQQPVLHDFPADLCRNISPPSAGGWRERSRGR